MFYLLSISQTIKLKNELGADGIIVFQSASLDLEQSTASVFDSSTINLLNAGDHLLHLCIRRRDNAIVVNSLTAGGDWGPEETKPHQGKFIGPNTTIMIYDHGDHYQILFDYHTVHYYKKRILKSATSISYGIADGQSLVFSNPLAVTTYSSMAQFVAGGG